jgi:hypothetical protein
MNYHTNHLYQILNMSILLHTTYTKIGGILWDTHHIKDLTIIYKNISINVTKNTTYKYLPNIQKWIANIIIDNKASK